MELRRSFSFVCAILLALVIPSTPIFAADSVLEDKNGDGAVSALAFGDSITYGVGDGIPVGQFIEEARPDGPKAGYPSRVARLAGIPVVNVGVPGEQFTTFGADRFPSTVASSSADIVFILEGSNDAVFQASTTLYRNKLQRSINVARAFGKEPVVLTIPPTCCNRAGQNLFSTSFNAQIRILSSINSVAIADVSRAFATTCKDKEECELLNKPEGLHPNSAGHQLIAETVLGAIYGIDVFTPTGAADLAVVLGVAPETISIQPDPSLVAQSGQSGGI